MATQLKKQPKLKASSDTRILSLERRMDDTQNILLPDIHKRLDDILVNVPDFTEDYEKMYRKQEINYYLQMAYWIILIVAATVITIKALRR